MATVNLPIFPLPVFLLSKGVTRLRIFEKRYLKMVAHAMKNDGFIVLPYDKAEKVGDIPTGSWVEIVNFDQSEDGLLLIDVQCKCLVDIYAMTQDKDKLHHGDVSVKAHWSDSGEDGTVDELADSLSKAFDDNPELTALYRQSDFSQDSWVIARWLELLPVSIDKKRLFAEPDSLNSAKEFLQNIILVE
jgi:Lon protease-like protein